MRTLATQVRLRRLDRAFSEALDRLLSEPAEREMAGLISAKLLELAGDVRGDTYTIENLPERLESLAADPWREMSAVKQSITAAMKRRWGVTGQ